MGILCEHMVVSVCEKVTGKMREVTDGSSFYCQGWKLMMNYEIAALHQIGAAWVVIDACFSLRKKAICLKHVLHIKIQKSKMQGIISWAPCDS